MTHSAAWRCAADELPPFEDVTATRVDLGALGSGLEATAEMIDASGLHS